MKTSADPRHLKRQQIVQELFQWSFRRQKINRPDIVNIIDHLDDIDQTIEKAAPLWPINQLSKIDLAILRLSLHELLYKKDAPQKVIIDEAVELAKEFGGDKSGKFINGVLGTVIKLNEKKHE